jgi:hypothetical protein
MRGKGLAVTLYTWRRRTGLIGRATDRVDITCSRRRRGMSAACAWRTL